MGLAVVLLAFSACGLTTVIAALALVEVLQALRLELETERRVAVLGCTAIGLASGLSSIAGPIPAVAVAKLAEAPYEVDRVFLWGLLGPWLVPAILAIGALAAALVPGSVKTRKEAPAEDPLTLWNILLLTTRMYVFIAGLVLLGAGLIPLIDRLILSAPPWLLYWVNSVSAVVDGATLASVELSPRMTQNQLRYTLMAIIISGGALITGNAHNLVVAHRLDLPARRWAAVGAPVAAALMLFYFLSLLALAG
jgi:predicted cation transporter